MKPKSLILKILLRSVSYILVAALASFGALYFFAEEPRYSKLMELEDLIHERFIGEADSAEMEDGAAAGMVAALGDRWSYYIPADEYAAHMEQMQNAYVGIGVTITTEFVNDGVEVLQVEPNGGAKAAGILVGDIILAVEDQSIAQIGIDAAKDLIRGEENTQVKLTILRGEQKLDLQVMRQIIEVQVASGQILEGNIGLVKINNFDERCADETLAAVEQLLDQGAEKLIFDVRFNPGGYKTELVEVLDYLLPEGALFRSLHYTGKETVDESDADCLEMPMAVLINGSSYSAAEFFAAALNEYDWAVVVGEPTVGKSYFQNTIQLKDGSAVGLSVGKYFTPNGVSLADEGGLQPEVKVEVDEETAAKIYSGELDPKEDPQILAAIEALK